MGVSLIYIPSQRIVDFVAEHPINWLQDYKRLAQRGGEGDKCGITPTPAVLEFLNLLHSNKGLFTQREYMDYCFSVWDASGWISNLPKSQKNGLGVRLYRNFYPSMIDSLHAWALLAETRIFDICFLDSTADAIAKTDLTLVKADTEYRIALYIGSKNGIKDRVYKLNNRNTESEVFCVDVVLPMERKPIHPGGKRWYELNDFRSVIIQYAMDDD